jgi:hypothetical protein
MEITMPPTTEVCREDLYEQVWSEPVTRVAHKYGITGTALSKICHKTGIPTPPVGYWQRLQYGYKPERPPLPALRGGMNSVITITRHPPKARPSPEAAARLAWEEDEKQRVHVSERLTPPHPLVRMTTEVFRGRQANQYGILVRPWKEKCLDLHVSRGSLPRALRIMDALIKALEARGFGVSVTEGERTGTWVELLGERLAIALEEKTTRKDHVLTKEEVERNAKYAWSSAPSWDYEPAGTLLFRIKEPWGDGVRKTWCDGRRQVVEDLLNDVIAGLIVAAEAKRQHEIEMERERKEWAEAERRRLEMEQRRREEAEQLKALEQEAAAWTRSQQLRAYIDALEREALKRVGAAEKGSKLQRWIEWARRHADRLDPLTVEQVETKGQVDALRLS